MSDKYSILETVKHCVYSYSMWDYFTNIAYEVTANSPASKVYKVNFKNENLTLIRYVVKTTFANKSFDIPILVYLSKNMPYEAPELYLERVQDTGVNPKNTDIDQETNKISTPSLINWNSRMSLSSVLNEVTGSFNKNFPIYKMTKNQQNLNDSTSTSNSSFNKSMNSSINSTYNPTNTFGTSYNYNNYNSSFNQAPLNNFSNSNNMNNPAPQVNYNTMGKVDGNAYSNFYKNIANRPPHQNTIYQSLYNNSNINNQNPYSQSTLNYQGFNNNPNTTSNVNYNMNNSTYPVPNNFSNQNYQMNYNNNLNNIHNNTSNFYNQPINNSHIGGQNFSSQINTNQSNFVMNNGLQNVNLNIDPKKIEEEAKQTIIQEIKNQILVKLREENEKNKQIENKLNNYRFEFNNEQEKLKKFLSDKDSKTSKIKDAIFALQSETQTQQMELSKIHDRLNNIQSLYSLIYVQKPELLRIIASEATCEELLASVKKAFQKQILTFDECVRNIRMLTREILKIRFYREKIMLRNK
jgi:hypothetical protein